MPRTQESCPPTHLVIGVQVLVLQWPVNQLQSLLSKVQEPLQNTHCLRQSFPDERAIVEVHVSSRELQDNAEANLSLDTLEKVRQTVWCYPYRPSAKMAQLKAERSSEPVISPLRKRESMGVSTPLPQLCGTLQRGLISLSAHPECQETVLRGNLIVINAYI